MHVCVWMCVCVCERDRKRVVYMCVHVNYVYVLKRERECVFVCVRVCVCVYIDTTLCNILVRSLCFFQALIRTHFNTSSASDLFDTYSCRPCI